MKKEEFLERRKSKHERKHAQDIINQDEKDNPGQTRLWDSDNVIKNINLMSTLKQDLVNVEATIKQLNKWQLNLGFDVSEFPEMEKLKL